MSVFESNVSPFKQAKYTLSGIVIFITVVKLIGFIDSNLLDKNTPWIIATSLLFVYMVFNSLFALNVEDNNTYYFHSILGFVSILIIGFFLSWLTSGVAIDEAGAFRWIFVVFTFVYIIFLLIIRSIKKIVKMAQREDHRMMK